MNKEKQTMDRTEIKKMAHGFIDKYLNGHPENKFKWQFVFKNTKYRLGRCFVNYQTKKASIELSIYMINKSIEAIKTTLLHEIAHGIEFIETGDSGHGKNWQRIMRSLGQKPERTANSVINKEFEKGIQHKYSGECPICKNVYHQNRMSEKAKRNMTKTYYCIECNKNRSRDNKVYIQFKQNY